MIARHVTPLAQPRFWQWFHGLSALMWLVLYAPAMLLWERSIPFLMFVSMQTALGGSLAGLAGAIAGRKADPEDDL
jgi:hypothetical protein